MSVNLTWNGQTKHFKVGPGTVLNDVLGDFCEEEGLSPMHWELRRKGRLISLSRPWRLLELPNNTTLDIVRRSTTPGDVRLQVVLPSGSRSKLSVPTMVSLGDILVRAGLGVEELPKVSVVTPGGQVSGELALEETTLDVLGIRGGSVLLRVRYFDGEEGEVDEETGVDGGFEEEAPKKKAEGPKPVKRGSLLADIVGEVGETASGEDLRSRAEWHARRAVLLLDKVGDGAVEVLQTVCKILDRVLGSVRGEMKVRMLLVENVKLQERLLRYEGGTGLLRAAGFVLASEMGERAGEVGILDGRERWVLPPWREHRECVETVRGVVYGTLVGLGSVEGLGEEAPEASPEFDPYQASVMRTGPPIPKQARSESSDPKERLDALKATLERIIAKPDDQQRHLRLETKITGPIPTTPVLEDESPTAEEHPETDEGPTSDMGIIASVARRKRERTKQLETLQTRSAREAESLRRRKVYPQTDVRVVFRDGSAAIGRFAASETIADVAQWVQSILTPDATSGALYTVPPKRKRKPEQSLHSLGMAPRARLVWFFDDDEKAPQPHPETAYFDPDLLQNPNPTPPPLPAPIPIEE